MTIAQVPDFAPLDTEAARALIMRSGAEYVGASLLVAQLADAVRGGLEPLTAVVQASELRN